MATHTPTPMLKIINSLSPTQTIHHLSKPAAMQSGIPRDLLDDLFSDTDTIEEAIPISIKASDEALTRVFAWMEKASAPAHKSSSISFADMLRKEKPSELPIERISGASLLFEIANAANYPAVEKLLDVVVSRIVRLLIGKSLKGMREFVGVQAVDGEEGEEGELASHLFAKMDLK
ncbi:hypothetical protein B0T14DRAFT_595355 [Immersiella caudata]|uniref:Uncharacterized protein n=1 Tax=Immersiella caudata TaxID=314043 RepID=A0AA39U6A1_9PEZI|nr:hypothetical protein B0T14DRAFT_595355 [Immersiella caudata]